jgi:putative alpha-1,2-mannosidase
MVDDVGDKDGSAVVMRFDPLKVGGEILVRVGLSFIDPVQACFNAAEEIPDFDFEEVQTSAVSQFTDLLNRIRVDTTGISDDTLTLFYSSVPPSPTTKYLTVALPHLPRPPKLHGRKSAVGN